MREVVVIGVGMHPFGKYLEKGLKELGREAVWRAVEDAGVSLPDIQVAYVSNALAGLITGQEGVRGEVVLRDAGFSGIPIINVENACASASTAFRGAWLEVASGMADVALALGVEKLYTEDTRQSIKALAADSDLELGRLGFQFTSYYAMELKKYMQRSGATREHFAQVVVKNSLNGSLNPHAQHRRPLSLAEVLGSRVIADPLTLYMCSSMADGAAAAILCAKEVAHKFTSGPLVEVATCCLRSGMFRRPGEETESSTTITVKQAYDMAGVGPEDIDVVEVHDAMAPAELMIYEELGLCGPNEGPMLIEEGATTLKGRIPVNPSGGLAAKGHPVGATGLAQLSEIVWHLRGQAGARQVEGARVGMVHNVGGFVEWDNAANTITILKR
ncbi:MAG: thiolase family protein [Dehalococcoidia bacterium]|jgi:acetyl-CoA acetyltransferase|nr:thiolase family protein [Dehalococcoidia bacterium]